MHLRYAVKVLSSGNETRRPKFHCLDFEDGLSFRGELVAGLYDGAFNVAQNQDEDGPVFVCLIFGLTSVARDVFCADRKTFVDLAPDRFGQAEERERSWVC